MIISTKLLLTKPEQEAKWRKALLHRKKKPALYVLCIHPDHTHPLEIFKTEDFLKADADDIRYCVIGLADSSSGSLELFERAVAEAVLRDPKLQDLKTDLQELFL